MHLMSPRLRLTRTASQFSVAPVFSACDVFFPQCSFPHLPEYRAPPVRRSLDLEIILILPDGGSAVLVKLMQVGPNSIALVPALSVSLGLLGPTGVAAGSHLPSWKDSTDRDQPYGLMHKSQDQKAS